MRYGKYIIIILLTFMFIFSSVVFASDKKRVAILDFGIPSQAVTNEEADYITELVRGAARRMLPMDKYIIITKENILEILPPGKSLDNCIGECAVETGRLIGADYVVTGEIIKFGDSLRVTFSIHNTLEGNLLSTKNAGADNVEALEAPVEKSSSELFISVPGAVSYKNSQSKESSTESKDSTRARAGDKISDELVIMDKEEYSVAQEQQALDKITRYDNELKYAKQGKEMAELDCSIAELFGNFRIISKNIDSFKKGFLHARRGLRNANSAFKIKGDETYEKEKQLLLNRCHKAYGRNINKYIHIYYRDRNMELTVSASKTVIEVSFNWQGKTDTLLAITDAGVEMFKRSQKKKDKEKYKSIAIRAASKAMKLEMAKLGDRPPRDGDEGFCKAFNALWHCYDDIGETKGRNSLEEQYGGACPVN